MTLQATSQRNDGDTDASTQATAIATRPIRYIFFFPTMSPARASGTMKTTEDRRNAVLTYAS